MGTSLSQRECRIRVLAHQLEMCDVADNPQEELILWAAEGLALQRRPGKVSWELEAQCTKKMGMTRSCEEVTWLLTLVCCLCCWSDKGGTL